jgi:predicted phosphodiesterase
MLAVAGPALGVTTRNVAVSKVTGTSAVLVVKSDVTSNVIVEYGQVSGIYTATAAGNGAARHELSLVGLSPSSTVYYRVTIIDAAAPSTSVTLPEKSFHTARAPGEGFSFAVAGDNRPAGDTTVQPAIWGTIVAQMTAENVDLALDVGDIIYGTGSDTLAQNAAKYEGLFAVTTGLTYSTPYYVAAGNHERLNYANSRAGYEQEFTFPVNNGTDGATYGEHYYSFDNGDTHFIALSTEIPGQEGMITGNQKTWLQADLAATDKPWIIVFMHRPLFSGAHTGDPWVNTGNLAGQQNKADIHALLLQYGVDIVFEGHDHYYLRHEQDGIQYVVTGGGGAPISGTPALGPGDVFAAGSYEHVKVDETATSLAVSVIDNTGATLESFSLTVPDLWMSLSPGNPYWGSYADYQARALSVEYTIANNGSGDAFDFQLLSFGATNQVEPLTATPISMGTLAAGSATNLQVTYRIPLGILSFMATSRASCTDDRGYVHVYS